MMARQHVLLALLLAGAAQTDALAQDGQALTDGKTFAESLMPASPGQIVNPSGVSATAWPSGSTNLPGSMPSGLGAFSAPTTSSTLYGTSGAQGALSGLGNARVQACKNYVPTGDPIADQECAAIKYMNNDCVPLNNSQLQVVGAAGANAGTGAGCTDTYGAGQSNFGYGNAVSTSDPIFQPVHTAQQTASSVTTQNCVSTPVVTKPAEFETNVCSKTIATDSHVCAQDLSVWATTTYSPATPYYTCSSGTLQGTYCVSSSSTPAAVTYSCPAGTLSGTMCINNSSSPASTTYTCPNGATLSGTTCVGQSTQPATLYYTCNSGTYNGSNCVSAIAAQNTSACPSNSVLLTGQNGQPDLCAVNYWVPNADCNSGPQGGSYGVWCTWPAPQTYSCPNGGTLSGSSCVTTTTATLNYQCSQGTLSGTSCIVDANGPATPVYSCNSGTLSGSQCVTSSTSPASATYSCAPGQILNGSMCVASSSDPATLHYSCPGGSTPVGSQCKTVVVHTQWNDHCTPYEHSAGITLGAPQ